ncbi:MAG: ABC transporter ATP-binding protein [Acidobacteria bacterium]|nr:ABC transporter ATP-binding protein [Acidobacteriota bacterium]
MSLIVAEGLTKTYTKGAVRVEALTDVTFTIEPASFVSFIGPSGSGKTTLLNLVGALDRPTTGKLLVSDTDIAGLDRRSAAVFRGRTIGFIFQEFNLIPVLTAYENVEYPLLLVQHVAPGERRRRVLALLDAVGVGDQRDKYPDQLSGGQKQRIAVARALVTNPQLVLADEPTANLDHANASMVVATMRRMRDTFGTTFVFSTHDPRVMSEAEVVFRLEDGRLVDREITGAAA